MAPFWPRARHCVLPVCSPGWAPAAAGAAGPQVILAAYVLGSFDLADAAKPAARSLTALARRRRAAAAGRCRCAVAAGFSRPGALGERLGVESLGAAARPGFCVIVGRPFRSLRAVRFGRAGACCGRVAGGPSQHPRRHLVSGPQPSAARWRLGPDAAATATTATTCRSARGASRACAKGRISGRGEGRQRALWAGGNGQRTGVAALAGGRTGRHRALAP